ncbi:MAG: cytochrome C [Burkholderiales bacterium]|nr:cytochrome C [Burkholderiales bacterium]MBY0576197.1 hypothetical protein [Gallionellaceae bacterium]
MFMQVFRWTVKLSGPVVIAASMLLSANAHAVPSFGRQIGMDCSGCHTVFPELNSFGRQFKLRGFTLGNALDDKKFPLNLPLSATAVASRNSTSNTNTPGAMLENFPRDAQTVLQTAGLYYGGRIAGNFGALVQYNYDGIEHTSKIEMADIRYANSTTFGNGKELIYGLTLNNNPTISDIFNTTPMWSFPHLMSDVAVMPAAKTLVDNSLFAQVGGVGVYGYWNNLLYGELAFYRRATKGLFRPFSSGVDITNVVDGYAPYWRFALQREAGAHSWMVGTYGMMADVFPDAGNPFGATNRFKDLALDGQYHYSAGDHSLSTHATWIREKQEWNASLPLGLTSNPSATLNTFRSDVHYFYKHQWGGGIQYFSTWGDADAMRYNTGQAVMGSATGSPNTKGWVFDLNYLPLQNIKLGVRYTRYDKFNGDSTNYDGMGRNARDNNTVFLYGWFMF